MRKHHRGKGVNNQVLNWTFKVDGLLYNASQEQVEHQNMCFLVLHCTNIKSDYKLFWET